MPNTPAFHVRHIPVYGDLILSPMDGYSDLPFRLICRELGSAMSYTEDVWQLHPIYCLLRPLTVEWGAQSQGIAHCRWELRN